MAVAKGRRSTGGCANIESVPGPVHRRGLASPSVVGIASWGQPVVGPMVRLLRRAGADLILNGHDHAYLRYPRLTEKGARDRQGSPGVRRGHWRRRTVPGSPGAARPAVASNRHHGVLRLRFRDKGYSWRFLSTTGAAVDRGTDTCR